jgi:hypothetical protein
MNEPPKRHLISRGNAMLDRMMAFRDRFGYSPRLSEQMSVPSYLDLIQQALDRGDVPAQLQQKTVGHQARSQPGRSV